MAKQRESRWVKVVVASIVRPIMTALTRAEWSGTENIPRSGGFILAANHLSMADPLTIAHYLYVGGRRWPTFTMKDGVMRIPVVKSVARATGQIPVKRGSAEAVKALGEAEKALVEDGSSVIFYPEGTVTRDPELWPMVGKTGIARLALSTGVPVIPLAHWGEHKLLEYGTNKLSLFPRKRVQMLAGPPVDLSAWLDQPMTATALSEATSAIMADITALQAQIRGGEPPAVPFDPKKARAAAAEAAGDADPAAPVEAPETADRAAPNGSAPDAAAPEPAAEQGTGDGAAKGAPQGGAAKSPEEGTG